MRKSNYDKFPFVAVPGADDACVAGWEAIGRRLRAAVSAGGPAKTVLVVECYPGVDEAAVREALARELKPARIVSAAEALKSEADINRLCEPFLGGDDLVFGFLSGLTLPQFFQEKHLWHWRETVERVKDGLVLVVGVGARLIAAGDILVYADLPRWEIQQRQRRNEISNLGANNAAQSAGAKYKRAFFIDWRVADRWKKPLLRQTDYFLDTTQPHEPKLANGDAVYRGLAEAARRPFRVVPFFDPGVWGGQWLKEV